MTQLRKHPIPILVTPGIEIEVKPPHWLKAPSPKLVTLLGIVIEVKPLHLLKALLPILFTVFGITVFLHPQIRVLLSLSIMALQLLRESYFVFFVSTDIEETEVQPSNA